MACWNTDPAVLSSQQVPLAVSSATTADRLRTSTRAPLPWRPCSVEGRAEERRAFETKTSPDPTNKIDKLSIEIFQQTTAYHDQVGERGEDRASQQVVLSRFFPQLPQVRHQVARERTHAELHSLDHERHDVQHFHL